MSKNVCGVSVVDGDFEKLKRFNISEIYHPTVDAPAAEVVEQPTEAPPELMTEKSHESMDIS